MNKTYMLIVTFLIAIIVSFSLGLSLTRPDHKLVPKRVPSIIILVHCKRNQWVLAVTSNKWILVRWSNRLLYERFLTKVYGLVSNQVTYRYDKTRCKI